MITAARRSPSPWTSSVYVAASSSGVSVWLRTNSREAGVSPGPCGTSQRISALVPWSTKCCGGSGLRIGADTAASGSRGARAVAGSMAAAYPTRLIDFAHRVPGETACLGRRHEVRHERPIACARPGTRRATRSRVTSHFPSAVPLGKWPDTTGPWYPAQPARAYRPGRTTSADPPPRRTGSETATTWPRSRNSIPVAAPISEALVPGGPGTTNEWPRGVSCAP